MLNLQFAYRRTAKTLDINGKPFRSAPHQSRYGTCRTLCSPRHSNRTALQTRLADGLLLILGDRVQLQQVMLNLILNAVEALSGSSKTARELLIRTELDGPGGVLVAVEDSGPGLKPQSLDGPFDAFYTTKPGGMGMGLSICRSIIEVHGGRVWATANVPKGARPSVHSTPTEGDRVLSKRPPRGNE